MVQVLLIFGDKDLRLLMESALRVHHLSALQASTGQEAEQTIQSHRVDLMVVDDTLPDENGISFISRMRKGRYQKRIVYFSTAACGPEDHARLEGDLGVALILYRPITPMQFARRISDLLESSSDGSRVSTPTRHPSQELLQIEQNFVSRFPKRLEELERELARAHAEPTLLPQVRQATHRLRGTAAPYGYHDVSDLLGSIEDLLDPLLEGAARRPAFLWERINRTLRDAVRCAKRGPDSAPSVSERFPTTHRPTLLVVDKDIEFLRLIRRLSSRHSIHTVTAQSVIEAMDIVETTPLSGVIFDVGFGGVSAAKAIEKLRSTPGNRGLPIVFTSTEGSLNTRLVAVAAGGTRFLNKPVSEHSFSELLQQLPHVERRALRIVVLDDDPIVVEKYSSDLQEAGYFVRALDSPDLLIDALEDVRPDALLLDVNLGALSGIDVCRALRSSEHWQFLPILMFSGDTGPEMRVRAYQAGATDFLAKPLSIDELMTRVRSQADRVRLMRERSDRDHLSGLMLRRVFVDALQRSLAACVRENKPLALVLFDLDHFKQINDVHGHLVGDRVIATFGELLRKRFRTEDLRGRWGGEEFVLAFPGEASDFAYGATQRLLKEFSGTRFEAEDGQSFAVTFTAGVVSFPDDGESLDVLLKRADDLLYEGKALGRARVCVGAPSVKSVETIKTD